MAYPYDEIYLESVQKNLGFFFQILSKPLANRSTPKQNTGAEQSSPIANGKRASRFPRFLPNTHLNGFYLITI